MASKAFKKVMKATWGETSDEESEGEKVENDNLALMARSDLESEGESSKFENIHKTFTAGNSKLEETVSAQKAENNKSEETISSLKAELLNIKKEKTVSNELINNDQESLEAEFTP
ncbi:hypothetical protein HAX54_012345 [Datura stramonium]|uniref:Uncharacterized protein n=1 Tax=Datura stramonium TaxID=4076 RepID=A0ABS8TJL9_DATST|nr:hypothetical protein [Datura stramonium]